MPSSLVDQSEHWSGWPVALGAIAALVCLGNDELALVGCWPGGRCVSGQWLSGCPLFVLRYQPANVVQAGGSGGPLAITPAW